MREILFKAKRIDNGEWVEGLLAFMRKINLSDEEELETENVLVIQNFIVDSVEIDESTICQYTGLTDKNGNKIWENDIVKIGTDSAIVIYSEKYSGYILQPIEDYYFDSPILAHNVDIIDNIIGNISDNSKLSEGEPQKDDIQDVIDRLIFCFGGSFVNQENEFIAHREASEYFRLEDCKTELSIKCKVLEWLSRAAFKTAPFETEKENEEFHEFMLNGINEFLGTEFTEDDIETIYIHIGNSINHQKTLEFIESGYNFSVLN